MDSESQSPMYDTGLSQLQLASLLLLDCVVITSVNKNKMKPLGCTQLGTNHSPPAPLYITCDWTQKHSEKSRDQRNYVTQNSTKRRHHISGNPPSSPLLMTTQTKVYTGLEEQKEIRKYVFHDGGVTWSTSCKKQISQAASKLQLSAPGSQKPDLFFGILFFCFWDQFTTTERIPVPDAYIKFAVA
jgi:hypothetical protein